MDTLVLSSTYEPVGHISWQRALTLVIGQRAEAVVHYADRIVRSVRQTFQVPAVIRFLKGAYFRKKVLRFSRDAIYARDRGCCQYCGAKISRNAATYDHVVPRSKGGETSWENIVCACFDCNQRKGARTPAEANMRPIVQPRAVRHVPTILRLQASGPLPEEWADFLTV